MKKKILIAICSVILIALGFLRDKIFVSINEETGQGMAGILNSDQRYLFIWKWALTFIFSFIYLFLTSILIYLVFQSKKYIWLAVFLYGALFAIAFFITGAGFLFSSFENVYHFTRVIMGIAQSPIPAIILIPALLINRIKIEDKKSG